ncbi:MAG: hypothetical protein ACHQC8_06670 [Solirubrobacterales bacterium]
MARRARIAYGFVLLVRASRELGDGQKLLLETMHGYDREGLTGMEAEGCYLSAPKLADNLGWTTARVEHVRRDLVTLGLLDARARRGRAGGRYFLTPPPGTIPSKAQPGPELSACRDAFDVHVANARLHPKMAHTGGANSQTGMAHIGSAIAPEFSTIPGLTTGNGANPSLERRETLDEVARESPATVRTQRSEYLKQQGSSEGTEGRNASLRVTGEGGARTKDATQDEATRRLELEQQALEAERKREAATDPGERRYYEIVATNRRRTLQGVAS